MNSQLEAGMRINPNIYVDGQHVMTVLPVMYFVDRQRNSGQSATEIALSWQVNRNPESRGTNERK